MRRLFLETGNTAVRPGLQNSETLCFLDRLIDWAGTFQAAAPAGTDVSRPVQANWVEQFVLDMAANDPNQGISIEIPLEPELLPALT